ncbi:hypothetical protein NKJ71_19535 [Mesorhizobium sp. M0050]|uniref:hypothetical protein n=1 Tax=Mesorhizobium sp. M0050 TaxID=2956861 RepID=UPI0033368969
MKHFTDEFLKEQYTLDFSSAGINPPLIPTVNVPPMFSKECLAALLKQHPDAPFVTTWHRCADGDVEIRCLSQGFFVGDIAGFAKEKFNGKGRGRRASFRIHCSTISL